MKQCHFDIVKCLGAPSVKDMMYVHTVCKTIKMFRTIHYTLLHSFYPRKH